MQTLIATLISIPIGVACSITAWWILFHKIVPRVRFSERISKTASDADSGFSYRIKFENVGRRDIIDIQIHAYLRIIGLRSRKPSGIMTNVKLSTSKEYVPKMMAAGKGFIISLYPERTRSFQRTAYPEDVRRKYEQKSLLLEDVLALGYDTKLRIVVFGYDSFSGARRVFESKLYGVDDIKMGRFKGLEIFADKTLDEV
jgi:hypothetical protein